MLQLYRKLSQPSLLATSFRAFSAGQKIAYGTDHPSKSKRYQKGLFHLKKHAQRRQRCFSMKYSLVTAKPNIARRTLTSTILGMSFRLWVSMKARRCIMKKGSLDNYLLETGTKYIDSRMGLHLR